MRPNLHLMKATLTGALGGLLFGFDTIVISGAIDALVRLYGLSAQGKGLTVAIGLVGMFQFNIVTGILLAYVSNYWIRTLQLGATEWRWQIGISVLPAFGFL